MLAPAWTDATMASDVCSNWLKRDGPWSRGAIGQVVARAKTFLLMAGSLAISIPRRTCPPMSDSGCDIRSIEAFR
jgi:hypothetical protein